MVNSYVAKHNQEQSGVNVKMIRYYIRDGSLVAVLDILFMVCVSTPQAHNVIQVSLGNNRKISVTLVFMVLLRVKGVNKPK